MVWIASTRVEALRRRGICGAVALAAMLAGFPPPPALGDVGSAVPPGPEAAARPPAPPGGPEAESKPFGLLGDVLVGAGAVLSFPFTLFGRYREAEEMERLRALDREMEREILERAGAGDGRARPPGAPASPPAGSHGLTVIQDHIAEGTSPLLLMPETPPPGSDPAPPIGGPVVRDGLIILKDHLASDPETAVPPAAPPGGMTPPERP